MHYLAEVFGEIFNPSEASIERRRQAERRRRDDLGWKGRLREDLKETALHTFWFGVVLMVVTVTFGVWGYGAWTLLAKFHHG